MGLTSQQFELAVASLATMARAAREIPLDDMLAVIEATEKQKALHKPTPTQIQNVEDIKRTATACLELRKVAIEIAEREAHATKSRIILPFGPQTTQ